MKLPVIQEWFKDGLQCECTGCGNCCTGGPGYFWMSEQEISRLAEYLKLSVSQTLKKYCRRLNGRISLKEKPPNARGEYDCIFLKEIPAEPGDGTTVQQSKRICTVYPVRPLQCRTWPFWEGNLASRQSWESAARRCPGMNAGRKWSAHEIVSRRDASKWPED